MAATIMMANLSESRHLQRVTILGSTGSIGVSTLDVIARHNELFSVFALTANTNVSVLLKQCLQFSPTYAVMSDEASARDLVEQLTAHHSDTVVLAGVQALQDVASHDDVDSVMAAIVGAAGLLPTMAAVKAGKKVLLANKESLVMAGRLFMDAVRDSGAQLLPIDSEHNAIFQCLPHHTESQQHIRKILLTGSGGPLRAWSASDIRSATPSQACAHPNWSMGRKISVDSASLMNKGLEFIEAKWLFDVAPSRIEVVIHPQSIIHSMVEYIDGSVLAQLGNPDMRTPIAYGLAYPERIDSGVSPLDIIAAARLDFESPNMQDFPALGLAIAAAESGAGAATVLNAANEIAVAEFLNKQISFGQMNDMLIAVMDTADWNEPVDLDDVLEVDQYARRMTTQLIGALC
jgi:1-deoxy-D-xylulose-5-phosphate reductoisomerase